MAIDFFNSESTTIKIGQLVKDTTIKERIKGDIRSSKDVSGIEIRMLPPLVIDNHTTPFWPFPGYSKVYCLTIVVSDVSNQLAGSIDLKGFPRIGDQEHLPINKTIFYWQSETENEKAPNQIHIMTSVIKSKQDLRDVGKILTKVKSDDNYKGLVKQISELAIKSSGVGIVLDLMGQVASLVGSYLGEVEDKPIGTTINSYTTLHGDFDILGITKTKIPTPDVIFEYDIVVRDKNADSSLAASKAKSNSRNFETSSEPAFDVNEKVEVEMMPL